MCEGRNGETDARWLPSLVAAVVTRGLRVDKMLARTGSEPQVRKGRQHQPCQTFKVMLVVVRRRRCTPVRTPADQHAARSRG